MADGWIGPMVRNTFGLIVTVFVVRLLDSLTTLAGGRRFSSWLGDALGIGNAGGQS